MTRKNRHFVYEGVGIIAVAFLLAIVIPSFVNSHDTVALFAGIALLGAALLWLAYFAYRINKEVEK